MNLYPQTEPYEHGHLDVGDGHLVYWETCGNPTGKPAVVLHGGPGSGCTPAWRGYFDPARYRVVLFDQRGCGRSTPSAGEPDADLSTNTLDNLVRDIEALREHLGIERWLVLGASWGTTLGVAYAERHPDRVTEAVLFLIALTQRREVEWITHDVGRIFPAEWERFRAGAVAAAPPAAGDGDLAAAYSRLLHDPDPAVREQAARDWCDWEDSHVAATANRRHSTRYDDPAFRLVFARLVTHYWSHAAWRAEGQLIADAARLAGIPGVLAHGRLDVSGPLETAWRLARAWPGSELTVVEDVGHSAGNPGIVDIVVGATDRFAGTLLA